MVLHMRFLENPDIVIYNALGKKDIPFQGHSPQKRNTWLMQRKNTPLYTPVNQKLREGCKTKSSATAGSKAYLYLTESVLMICN